ncbi:hypothetical protein ACLOJK_022789 [Asimina triloba]
MDALFEAQFSPLAESGCLLSKCGKCARYMKYISTQPSRLYCSTCEEVYYLSQRGTIKLFLFSLVGPEGKSFPLCPYCYNNPPFEGIETLFGAMKIGSSGKLGKGAIGPEGKSFPLRPYCYNSPPFEVIEMVFGAMKTGSSGKLGKGAVQWNTCSGPSQRPQVEALLQHVQLPCVPSQGAHKISITCERCADCDLTIIEVDFNKKTTPLSNGATLYVSCILCDELLHSLIEMKHGKSFLK